MFGELLNGDIYVLLMEITGLNKNMSRNQFKQMFYAYLYRPAFSKYDRSKSTLQKRENGEYYIEKVEEPVWRAVNTLMPGIGFFIDLCKCIPGTRQRGKTDYKCISQAILKIESKIMLEAVANLWKKYPRMFLTTLHDSITCLPKDKAKVEAELMRTFRKYHVTPKFG
jgi:hypothetical protein